MQERKNCFLIKDDNVKIIFTKREVDAKNILDIEKVCLENNLTFKNIKYLEQIHSNKVVVVDENFLNNFKADGLVTNKKNTPIMIFTADCVPIVFYDKKKGIISLAHAGWRGVYDNIVKNTIAVMKNDFRCKVEDIKIVIAPRISEKNYNVSLDLINKFLQKGYSFYKKEEDKYLLDLTSIVEKQLTNEGILKENIYKTSFCTVENNDKFFSYRKDSQTKKRIGTIIEIG